MICVNRDELLKVITALDFLPSTCNYILIHTPPTVKLFKNTIPLLSEPTSLESNFISPLEC